MRQLKAEFYKMRHTFLFPIHVIVPVAAGILFLAWTRISAQDVYKRQLSWCIG